MQSKHAGAPAPEVEPEHREPLSRARILARALVLIDRDGLESLSMRRLASELDAAPMSLYNHVSSKEALLGGVVEALLTEIELPEASDDWVETMRTGFLSFREVLLAHPNALPLIQSRGAPGTPEAMRPIEYSLEILRRGGFAPEIALQAHWALVGYTLGHVNFQLTSPLTGGDTEHDHSDLAPQEFPYCVEILPYAQDCDFEAAFEFGLDAMLRGLQQRVAAGTIDERKSVG